MPEQSPLERAARALGAETMNCLPSEVDPREWIEQARAVLMAIREPSESMKSVGVTAYQTGDHSNDIYRKMIDAALGNAS